MKLLLPIVILFVPSESWSQNLLNRHDRISKVEYQQLKKQKENFIPDNLRADTVIVVRYTVSRLEYMQRIARQIEFSRHGVDTTGYTDELLFGKNQVEHARRHLAKERLRFPDEQTKALAKKGITAIVVDEGLLDSNDSFKNKVWMLTDFICSQDRYRGPWISSMRNRFYDSNLKKHYEIFRPLNYDVLDLLD